MSCGTSPSIQHRQTISQNLVKASPLRHFRISAGKPPWPRAFPDASDLRGSFISSLVGSLYSSFRTEGHRACVLSTRFYGSESWGAYNLTENFGNSGWKVNGKVPTENWGVRFEVVRSFRFVLVNQTECCLPLTNFSVPSRFQTRATQIRPFLDSNRNGCSLPLCFRLPERIFLSNGKQPWTLHARQKCKLNAIHMRCLRRLLNIKR